MLHLLTLSLLSLRIVLAAPATHRPGQEFTVVFDTLHPASHEVATVLDRLSLSTAHPDVRHVYNNTAFRGFSASMQSHCLDLLANMSGIAVVEKAVKISSAVTARIGAPWGLQRISTASSVSGSSNGMNYMYTYANNNLGAGADVYVLDSGIYTDHVAFSGRARMVWSFDNNTTDNDGHGTHVSGIAGGETIGVASQANILGVKAIDSEGNGWSSNVIAAIDYVISAHSIRKAANDSFVGSVMSMSLESSTVVAINQAVSAATQAGIHVVVAAGNSGTDACKSSPASAGGTNGPAITVGSIGIGATVSSFSNTGPCVDVYAPGENVLSSWNSGPHSIKALSGTSMATPHVTGIVAYAMANSTLAGDTGMMKEWVRMTALQNVVSGKVILGDPLLLANNGVPGQSIDTKDGMLGLTRGMNST